MSWPDMFYGVYIGPFLLVAGLILLVGTRQKKEDKFLTLKES